MAKVQRARWDGGPTVFADAIRHLCVSPNFLQYDEADRVEDSVVHPDKVLAASPLLEVLYALDPALNFKRKTVQDAYAIIASEKTKWDFDKQHKKHWSQSMAKRTMNVCRALKQSRVKQASWVSNLSFLQAGDEQELRNEDDDDDDAWWTGWNAEQNMAYRCKPHSSDQELAVGAVVPEGAMPTDPVEAKFNEGSTCSVESMTVAEWLGVQQAKKSRGSRETATVYWEGRHRLTGHVLQLKDRKDRDELPLLSLYDDGGQVLQAKPDALPTKDEVVAMMIDIGKRYGAGELKRVQLKEVRNSFLKGALKSRTSSRKAPEATEHGASSGSLQSKAKPKKKTTKKPSARDIDVTGGGETARDCDKTDGGGSGTRARECERHGGDASPSSSSKRLRGNQDEATNDEALTTPGASSAPSPGAQYVFDDPPPGEFDMLRAWCEGLYDEF